VVEVTPAGLLTANKPVKDEYADACCGCERVTLSKTAPKIPDALMRKTEQKWISQVDNSRV
jgi:hypothetical protein